MTSPLDTDERIVAEKQRALEWVFEHWTRSPDKTCPICGARKWIVGEVVQIQPVIRPGYPVTAEVYPHFPFACGVCGYTMLFNALVSGVIARPNTDYNGNPLPAATEPSGE